MFLSSVSTHVPGWLYAPWCGLAWWHCARVCVHVWYREDLDSERWCIMRLDCAIWLMVWGFVHADTCCGFLRHSWVFLLFYWIKCYFSGNHNPCQSIIYIQAENKFLIVWVLSWHLISEVIQLSAVALFSQKIIIFFLVSYLYIFKWCS